VYNNKIERKTSISPQRMGYLFGREGWLFHEKVHSSIVFYRIVIVPIGGHAEMEKTSSRICSQYF